MINKALKEVERGITKPLMRLVGIKLPAKTKRRRRSKRRY